MTLLDLVDLSLSRPGISSLCCRVDKTQIARCTAIGFFLRGNLEDNLNASDFNIYFFTSMWVKLLFFYRL